MKNIDWYFTSFLVFAIYIFGGLISDVGETYGPSTYKYSSAFGWLVLSGGLFLLGYFSGRKSK